jgi:RHS repeat-associated protein
VARQLYDAWGNVRYVTGTLPTDIGYTGQRFDSYIKLVQMGARWYDPEIGRWLSPDTIVPQLGNPQDLNRYSYTRNNPVKYTDPTGHCSQNRDRDSECWEQHDKLVAALGNAYADDGSLAGWSTAQLSSLLGWIGKGLITFAGNPWTGGNLGNVRDALSRVSNALGNKTLTTLGLNGGTLTFDNTSGILHADQPHNRVYGEFKAEFDADQSDEIIHELGHLADWHARPASAPWRWSAVSTEWGIASGWRKHPEHGFWYITAKGREGAPTLYAQSKDPGEDFADTFATFVDQRNGRTFYRSILNTPQQYQNFATRLNALTVALGIP